MTTETDFIIWRSQGTSHPGNKRSINEDAYLDLSEIGLWAVADGMGGHKAGDVASRLIIENLKQLDEPNSIGNFVGMVCDCLHDVNEELIDLSRAYDDQVIGSTIVVLLHYGSDGAIVWAGDSRVYRIRDKQISLLTVDHCIAEEYIAQGIYDREKAYSLTDAAILTRAVGGEDFLDLDIIRFPLQTDDTYILCSDGLYKELSAEDLLALHQQKQAIEEFPMVALQHALQGTARDNISLVVVENKSIDC